MTKTLSRSSWKQTKLICLQTVPAISHKAAITLHILDTIVRNKYKKDPKLAEWVIASHVEKHTPEKREKKPMTKPPAT